MNPQICGDDSALPSQSVFDTATCTGLETKQIETQRENSPNNSLPLRTNCSNDQHHRDEQQPFDTTTRKRIAEEEKARMITHGSNKTTVTMTMIRPPGVSTAKARDRRFIHLSEEPEQTALDHSKNIATNPDSVQA